jgi:hypothetical protein
VLHIAERCDKLMPSDPGAQARTKTWMFAALNTIEPPIMFLNQIDMQPAGEGAADQQRSRVVAAIKSRLACLSGRLDGRDYLEDRFTAADLLMTTVLRILRRTDLVAEMPALEAYRLRCEARPAFQSPWRSDGALRRECTFETLTVFVLPNRSDELSGPFPNLADFPVIAAAKAHIPMTHHRRRHHDRKRSREQQGRERPDRAV